MNLKSSVSDKGQIVTQILYSLGGHKKTIHGVLTDTIEQSQFTRFDLTNGHRFYVNDNLIWLIEVIPETPT